MKKKKKQYQFTVFERNGQLVFSLNSEIMIPENAPVRLLNAQLEELEYGKLYEAHADIFGTIPVAEALLAKGAQLGAILSFMMAVTTLSLPSLIMLRKAVKPKLLALFIGVCIVGIILVGYLFNIFQFLFI